MPSFRPLSIVLCAAVLLLAGCAQAPTRPAKYVAKPDSSQAIVTFVRESVFVGDGSPVYIWDGDKFVGTLASHTLVQYRVAPGPHVFMAAAENWSYVKADLQAGKHYYIKANIFPGVLMSRFVLKPVPNDDKRLQTW